MNNDYIFMIGMIFIKCVTVTVTNFILYIEIYDLTILLSLSY